jgi:Protein of unknown function (DUF3591)
VVQNIGMASLIYNYYRKKDEKDTFVPKMQNGGAYILESVDVSPFFGFGDVKPGETIQTIYNNLFRAPIFPQNIPKTDYLCIRYRLLTQTHISRRNKVLFERYSWYVPGWPELSRPGSPTSTSA